MPNPNLPSFPYVVPSDINFSVASDDAETQLTYDISNNQTAIIVNSTDIFNAPCLIVIDNEIIQVLLIQGNNFAQCVRGFANTLPASHFSGALVSGYILAYHHNQVAAEITSISNLLIKSDLAGLRTNENLLKYSQAFERSNYWLTASGTTIISTNNTSPINDASARILLEGNTYGVNSISALPDNLSVNWPYTFSVYAKFTNSNFIVLGQNILNDSTRTVYFDIFNGVVGSQGSNANGSIISIGNGWYRCMVTTTCTSVAYKSFDIAITHANNSVAYLGTQISSVQLWGAQVRSGDLSNPMSYIATIGNSLSFNTGGELLLDLGTIL